MTSPKNGTYALVDKAVEELKLFTIIELITHLKFHNPSSIFSQNSISAYISNKLSDGKIINAGKTQGAIKTYRFIKNINMFSSMKLTKS